MNWKMLERMRMPHGISSPWELMISDLESDTDCVTQIKACIINKLYL